MRRKRFMPTWKVDDLNILIIETIQHKMEKKSIEFRKVHNSFSTSPISLSIRSEIIR